MKKAYLYILLMATAFLAGCGTDDDAVLESQVKKVYLSFAPLANVVTRAAADNLPEEYAIKNLSVFLTEVGSGTIINSYPGISFTPADPNPAGDTLNHKMITLPLDPTTIQRKDVYVIANYPGTLPAVTTIEQLKAIQTPAATSAAGLSVANGLPMYGELLNANLSSTSANAPVLVPLTRVCAKFRVTLTFVDATYAGTGNSFTMLNVPSYTLYGGGNAASSSALITYPATALPSTGTLRYQGVAYVYESMVMPTINVNTTINGVAKTYKISTNLPVSSRNNLYDIDVKVYKPVKASTRGGVGLDSDSGLCSGSDSGLCSGSDSGSDSVNLDLDSDSSKAEAEMLNCKVSICIR